VVASVHLDDGGPVYFSVNAVEVEVCPA